LAYRAKLVLQAVEQELQWKDPANLQRFGRFLLAGLPSDLTTIFSFAYGKGARIHSNSWGGGSAGSYDDQCLQVDRFIWRKPDFCILFAAGNDGRDGNANGAIDLGSVTPPGTAKNCITVGASENNRPQMTLTYGTGWPDDYPSNPIKSDRLANDPNDIAAFSSRGPTADGRVKPDVVAPGTYILSTRSRLLAANNFGYGRFGSSTLYMFDSGTSMATPLTAGAVAVVREYLRKTVKIASPSAALLKAALIAGAQPVRPAAVPPDNDQGFGRVNLDNLLSPPAPLKAAFIEGKGLATGSLDERAVTVAQGGQPLKIVLAYSDFPGPRLVNNLNLIVRGPTGAVIQVGNAGAGNSFDTKNNVELAMFPQAGAGSYRLQVVGSNVPNGPQPFALVVIGALGS
jgi:serine protease AprX